MPTYLIEDGDVRILYSSGWRTSCAGIDVGSVHCADGPSNGPQMRHQPAAIATFTFNGTAIRVYGPKPYPTNPSSSAWFGVDDLPYDAVPSNSSAAQSDSERALLFSQNFSTQGPHTLFIQPHAHFALDSIEYDAVDNVSSAIPANNETSSQSGSLSQENTPHHDAAAGIVGGLLGAIIIVLCIIIGVLLSRRRRDRRAKKPASLAAVPFKFKDAPVLDYVPETLPTLGRQVSDRRLPRKPPPALHDNHLDVKYHLPSPALGYGWTSEKAHFGDMARSSGSNRLGCEAGRGRTTGRAM
ncbi:hypothetical protein BD626DRAFT_629294 [Schizophyllum amplum]|uniref:Uncharacterized protein n=1 Tax=Schizophyllum amplum TaxID=97359 RepID=A0A550CHQ4_9AGAR|nr:hypothetical protein BD626DRAFT_629294 [Auriculariopsis ampla]